MNEPQAKHIRDAEWTVRCNLAKLYRLADMHGMSDLIYNHISMRVPGMEDALFLNPFGMLYSDVTASALVRIDHLGNPLDDPKARVNRAGVVIHAAVHAARPEVQCVLHAHTVAGMAVSAQAEGLLPLTQHAMMFHGRIGYHDYQSFATADEERALIAHDLGTNDILILRNHGTLVCGRNVGECFHTAWHLERACQAQLMARAGGRLHLPPADVMEKTSARMAAAPPEYYDFFWNACLDLLPDRGKACEK